MIKNYSVFFCFFSGLLSFFSPCVLPLIPVYLSYITGYSIEEFKNKKISYSKILFPSFLFVLGFTTVFVSLGATASFLGNFIGTGKNFLRYIGGILMIIFGLHIIGILKIRKFYEIRRFRFKKINIGYLNAFILGMGLAGAWTPCVGPVLSSILILASMEKTVKRGILLLFSYSFGMGIPFIILSIFIKGLTSLLNKMKNYYEKIEISIGVLLCFFGLLIIIKRF
ncbi:MAG: cytochrome c biogenesis protein CcdA [candidate division WOR-3 bacterium]|nr:cytochrome c biogenesis protein CcdA [Candidatus Omnitrophota bacterium]MCM8807072.1 cytochrome c biogenesis protein CcdA [Candidatus Omnitrophota bacterium]